MKTKRRPVRWHGPSVFLVYRADIEGCSLPRVFSTLRRARAYIKKWCGKTHSMRGSGLFDGVVLTQVPLDFDRSATHPNKPGKIMLPHPRRQIEEHNGRGERWDK